MAFPERRTVDILLTTALLASVGIGVYCARRVILIFSLFHTFHLPPPSGGEVSAATFSVLQKSTRARCRRGVPRVCAAYRARGLPVCPRPVKKYCEGDG
jgi:hypothetical protein